MHTQYADMSARLKKSIGRIYSAIVWLFYFWLLVAFPIQLANHLIPGQKTVLPTKKFPLSLELRGLDLYIKNPGYVASGSGWTLYPTPKKEFEFTDLSTELKIPQSILAKLLKLPEEPFSYSLCFRNESYFVGSNGTRFEMPRQSMKLLFKSGRILEILKEECPKDMGEAVLMNAIINLPPLGEIAEAANKTGVIALSGTNIQFDNSVKNPVPFSYTVSGSEFYMNGKRLKGQIDDKGSRGGSFAIDMSDTNVITQLQSVQELTVIAKADPLEQAAMTITLFAAWWAIAIAFLHGAKEIISILSLKAIAKSIFSSYLNAQRKRKKLARSNVIGGPGGS